MMAGPPPNWENCSGRAKYLKEYTAIVRGVPDWTEYDMRETLDDKPCARFFRCQVRPGIRHDHALRPDRNGAQTHQIRRHLAALKHHVVGDPRYGRGKGFELQLLATSLAFTCPFSGKAQRWEVAPLPFPIS